MVGTVALMRQIRANNAAKTRAAQTAVAQQIVNQASTAKNTNVAEAVQQLSNSIKAASDDVKATTNSTSSNTTQAPSNAASAGTSTTVTPANVVKTASAAATTTPATPAKQTIQFVTENGKNYQIINGKKYLDLTDPNKGVVKATQVNSTPKTTTSSPVANTAAAIAAGSKAASAAKPSISSSGSSTYYDVDTALSSVYSQAVKAGIKVDKPKTYGKTITSSSQAQKIVDDYTAKANKLGTAASGGGAKATAVKSTYDISSQLKSIQSTAKQYGASVSLPSKTTYSSAAEAQKALDSYVSSAQKAIDAKASAAQSNANAVAAKKTYSNTNKYGMTQAQWTQYQNSQKNLPAWQQEGPIYWQWAHQMNGTGGGIPPATGSYDSGSWTPTEVAVDAAQLRLAQEAASQAAYSQQAAAAALERERTALAKGIATDEANAANAAKGVVSHASGSTVKINSPSVSASKQTTPVKVTSTPAAQVSTNKATVIKASTPAATTPIMTGSSALAQYNRAAEAKTASSSSSSTPKTISVSDKKVTPFTDSAKQIAPTTNSKTPLTVTTKAESPFTNKATVVPKASLVNETSVEKISASGAHELVGQTYGSSAAEKAQNLADYNKLISSGKVTSNANASGAVNTFKASEGSGVAKAATANSGYDATVKANQAAAAKAKAEYEAAKAASTPLWDKDVTAINQITDKSGNATISRGALGQEVTISSKVKVNGEDKTYTRGGEQTSVDAATAKNPFTKASANLVNVDKKTGALSFNVAQKSYSDVAAFKTTDQLAQEAKIAQAVAEARKINPNGSKEYFEGVAEVARRNQQSTLANLSEDWSRANAKTSQAIAPLFRKAEEAKKAYTNALAGTSISLNDKGQVFIDRKGSENKNAKVTFNAKEAQDKTIQGNVVLSGANQFLQSEYNSLKNKPLTYAAEVAATYVAGAAVGAAFGGAKVLTKAGAGKIASKLASPVAKDAITISGKYLPDAAMTGSMLGGLKGSADATFKNPNYQKLSAAEQEDVKQNYVSGLFGSAKEMAIGWKSFSRSSEIGEALTSKAIKSSPWKLVSKPSGLEDALPSEFDVTNVAKYANNKPKTTTEKVAELKERVKELENSEKVNDQQVVKAIKRQINAYETQPKNVNALADLKMKNRTDIKEVAEIQAFDARLKELREMKEVADRFGGSALNKATPTEADLKKALSAFSTTENMRIDGIKTGFDGLSVKRVQPTTRVEFAKDTPAVVKSLSSDVGKSAKLKIESTKTELASAKTRLQLPTRKIVISTEPRSINIKGKISSLSDKIRNDAISRARESDFDAAHEVLKAEAKLKQYEAALEKARVQNEVAQEAYYTAKVADAKVDLSIAKKEAAIRGSISRTIRTNEPLKLDEFTLRKVTDEAIAEYNKTQPRTSKTTRSEFNTELARQRKEAYENTDIAKLRKQALNEQQERLEMQDVADSWMEPYSKGLFKQPAAKDAFVKASNKNTLGFKRRQFQEIQEAHKRLQKQMDMEKQFEAPSDITDVAGFNKAKSETPFTKKQAKEQTQDAIHKAEQRLRADARTAKTFETQPRDISNIAATRRANIKLKNEPLSMQDIADFKAKNPGKYNVNKDSGDVWASMKERAVEYNEAQAMKIAEQRKADNRRFELSEKSKILDAEEYSLLHEVERTGDWSKYIEQTNKTRQKAKQEEERFNSWTEAQKKKTEVKEAKREKQAVEENEHFESWIEAQKKKSAKIEAEREYKQSAEYKAKEEVHFKAWEEAQKQKSTKKEAERAAKQAEDKEDIHFKAWEEAQKRKSKAKEKESAYRQTNEYKAKEEAHYKAWEEAQRKKMEAREFREQPVVVKRESNVDLDMIVKNTEKGVYDNYPGVEKTSSKIFAKKQPMDRFSEAVKRAQKRNEEIRKSYESSGTSTDSGNLKLMQKNEVKSEVKSEIKLEVKKAERSKIRSRRTDPEFKKVDAKTVKAEAKAEKEAKQKIKLEQKKRVREGYVASYPYVSSSYGDMTDEYTYLRTPVGGKNSHGIRNSPFVGSYTGIGSGNRNFRDSHKASDNRVKPNIVTPIKPNPVKPINGTPVKPILINPVKPVIINPVKPETVTPTKTTIVPKTDTPVISIIKPIVINDTPVPGTPKLKQVGTSQWHMFGAIRQEQTPKIIKREKKEDRIDVNKWARAKDKKLVSKTAVASFRDMYGQAKKPRGSPFKK